MKNLVPHSLVPAECRKEWDEFSGLLRSKRVLDERRDVLPFFRKSHHLSTLIGNYLSKIKKPNRFAHEYRIYGDFVADLIVGDASVQKYMLVEFENGSHDSVFRQKANKATPDWAPRFEGAYSQIIDWLWKLGDMRSTADFQNTFGSSQATIQGLIVIGKDMNLAPREEHRLKWRIDRTLIDSNAVSCVSFDELSIDLDHWLRTYHGV